MQEYIKYFSGLKRNYGVCKTTEGFVDGETGKKRYPHEWSSIPVVVSSGPFVYAVTAFMYNNTTCSVVVLLSWLYIRF